MNNDGFGQVGAGQDDRRLAGDDLQHYGQMRTADENPRGVVSIVKPQEEGGGPMKEHMEHKMHEHKGHREGHANPMHQQLEQEKSRHHEAMQHHNHHLAKHHGRHFDSQHGHDTYQHGR